MERLWSGWRAAYVTGLTGEIAGEGAGEAAGDLAGARDGCLFCRLGAIDDDEGYILERTDLTYTVMNVYPYTSGHLMVAPLRHEADVEGLTGAEGAALFGALQRAIVAVKKALTPEGINLGANLGRVAGAGVPGHVHLHALPRWAGDTNFMTSVAEVRVLPEDLRTTWSRLRAMWPTEDGS